MYFPFAASEQDLYYYCGLTIALAMVHVKRGPQFISKTLYDIITKGASNVKLTMDDVYPLDVRDKLVKVKPFIIRLTVAAILCICRRK
jgi:hypothetical protein